MPSGVRPQPPTGVARVALSGTILTHKWVAVGWVKLTHTNPITINDLSSLATSIDTTFNTTLRTALSADMVLKQIDVKFYPGGGTVLEYVKAVTRAGSLGAAVNDAGACAVINWIIASLYRGGHPRTYMPGVPTASVTAGSTYSGSFATDLAVAAEAYRNGLNAVTTTNITAVDFGTVRFQSNDTWLSPPVFYPFTSSKIRPNLGSQRRRILA